MADDSSVDTSIPGASPSQPDPGPSEGDVNNELFGGQKPGNYNPAPSPGQSTDDQGDYLLREQQRLYEQDRKRMQDSASEYDKYRESIDNINRQLAQLKPPTQRPYPSMPDAQQQKGNIGTMMGQILQLVAIGSAVFGKHKNPYQNAIAMSGAGAFLQGFSNGQHQQATEALQNWNKSVELTDKLNRQDTQDYTDILDNAKLTLSDQYKAIEALSLQRRDSEMYTAAARKDLDAIVKTLGNKDKANVAWYKAQGSVNKTIFNQWLKTKEGKDWEGWVMSKSNGQIDPAKSADDFKKANQMYPLSKWIDEHVTKQQDSGGENAPLPVYNVVQAKQQPVGTEFHAPDGTHYKVISTDPFQVEKIAD